ncbi:MAG: relaxase/mobilization nuclease domain-containing protein [Oscillospiraceae bacterium]|nr:relaxase/mobilization nuclease domain-containing protein [Oscillospiraceae bacterium]
MATTWIKPLHIGSKRARSTVVSDIIGYIKNPQKTDGGSLIAAYGCDSRSADDEFMLAKREYEDITGRSQGRRDVLAYHIRQSFKPGEVDAETANKIGYELTMSFTKGNHAFVVATHIDKAHIHNHIIFNSTALSCERKFNNFYRSDKTVRRISDLLCIENGLSIIENPQPSKGRNYAKHIGRPATWQEKLCRQIDGLLPSCAAFDDFIAAMKSAGYTVNEKRKHITFLAPGQIKPTRLDTLGGEYTEAAIRERLGMTRTIAASGAGGGLDTGIHARYTDEPTRVSLLIDIQAKIQEGNGAGYERWARIFNLKESARTLLFLKENGIDSYDDLVQKTAAASADFDERMTKIKSAEKRMAEITELQKHIGAYGKTREVYAKYKASGWNSDFYEEHRTDITLHNAAKKHFDDLKIKKLPTIASLKQEYAVHAAEKKSLYHGYHEAKDTMRQLLVAKGNASRILGIANDARERDDMRGRARSIAPDR